MHYQNQQRKKFKIKFQVLIKFAKILPDYMAKYVDPITQLRTCVIKIGTFNGQGG